MPGVDAITRCISNAIVPRVEKKLREEADALLRKKKMKDRKKKLNRAREISREKSKRAHRGTD